MASSFFNFRQKTVKNGDKLGNKKYVIEIVVEQLILGVHILDSPAFFYRKILPFLILLKN